MHVVRDLLCVMCACVRVTCGIVSGLWVGQRTRKLLAVYAWLYAICARHTYPYILAMHARRLHCRYRVRIMGTPIEMRHSCIKSADFEVI
jgi:DMSO/TMAO reductase YedYZ heme-binding membrane subunit